MEQQKRMTIGLFICHLDNDYAYDICKGVDYAAKELDVNLVIFPGMYINAAYNDPQNAKYDYQYNSIFHYAKSGGIDALIISIGTIGTFLTDADNLAFLNHFSDIPILTLESEYGDYPSLIIDSVQGLKEVIEHLIRHHGKKHIGFISGRPGNSDAQERLDVYKDTLIENGLTVDKNLIRYGNFSEFCEEQVEDLLDSNPELDAIVFANDQMALGGYNVLKRRGIEIGKQISVTGFDDVPIALALEPALTTVRANATELGYRAVKEAVTLVKTGHTDISRLPSSMIVRESCGCTTDISTEDSELKEQLAALSNEQLREHILEIIFKNDLNSFFYPRIREIMVPYIDLILNDLRNKNKKTFPTEQLKQIMHKFCISDIPIYYSIVQMSYILHSMDELILSLIDSTEKRIAYATASNSVYMQLLASESGNRYREKRDYKMNTWSSSYLIRDTITKGENKDSAYAQIGDKLQKLRFISSYVYTVNPNDILLKTDGSWRIPKKVQLMVYNKNGQTVPLATQNEMIPTGELFNNRFMPNDRRFTMVLVPIFTSEEHHGLFLCEPDIESFHHIYSISLELGTSLKFLKIYDELQDANQQLEYTLSILNEKNSQLNKISTIDELTGLKNRRGFMTESQTIINSALNTGNRAILLFADMDNLKAVNDKFGHENGDFALRTISDALKTSLRNGDIIGRIGGDEFVAFALLGSQQSSDVIATRIHKKLETFNKSSDKPYYVEASIGIVDFTCGPEVDLQELLKKADDALYDNKSHKRTNVVKEGM